MNHLDLRRTAAFLLTSAGLLTFGLSGTVLADDDEHEIDEPPAMTSVKGDFTPGSAIVAEFPCGDPQNSVGSLSLLDMQETTVATNSLPGAPVAGDFVIEVVIPESIEPGTGLALFGECVTEGDTPTEINFAPVEIVVASSVEVPATGSSSTTLLAIAGVLVAAGMALTLPLTLPRRRLGAR